MTTLSSTFRPTLRSTLTPSLGFGLGVPYYKEGLVMDLSTVVGPFEILDQTINDNDATLYSGRFVSTDGVADAIFRDPMTGLGLDLSGTTTTSGSVYLEITLRGDGTDYYINLGDGAGYLTLSTTSGVWLTSSSLQSLLFFGLDDVIIGSANSGALNSAGDVSDFTIYDAPFISGSGHVKGAVLYRWTLADHADLLDAGLDGLTVADSGPSQSHGTCDGCNGGTGEAEIHQTGAVNWNNYQYFNGSNYYIETSHEIIANSSLKIQFSMLNGAVGVDNMIAGCFSDSIQGSADNRCLFLMAMADGDLRVLTNEDGEGVGNEESFYTAGLNDSAPHDIDVLWGSGGVLTVSVDGVVIAAQGGGGVASSLFNSDVTFKWGNHGATTSSFTGLLYNRILTDDGTIILTETANGSSIRQLVSASDANDQIDAFGNAIVEPRLNNEQINLFGEGEHALVPDNASLDLTTTATWELWGNFYGDGGFNRAVLSKWDSASGNFRSWLIYNNKLTADGTLTILLSSDGGSAGGVDLVIADEVAHIVFTYDSGTLLAYVNGALTATTAAGTTPTTLFVNSQDVLIGASNPSSLTNLANKRIGSSKIYSPALTAEQALQNYNAQKSKYGL